MAIEFIASDPARFSTALQRFDEANARDPNSELVAGVARPRGLVYAERLTEWVLRLAPAASETLRLAARCQHLCRWKIPRNSYPMDRAGYLKWRTDLKRFHAETAGKILRDVGYADELIRRVQALNLKQNQSTDAETQILEDALCLVFLEYQFGPLAAKTAPEKMITALQKSWAKMSPAGQAEARRLNYTEIEQRLLASALNSGTAAHKATGRRKSGFWHESSSRDT